MWWYPLLSGQFIIFISTSCNRILWTFLPRAAVHGISVFLPMKTVHTEASFAPVTYGWTWTGGAVPNFHVQTESYIWNLEKCSRIYQLCFSHLQLRWSLKNLTRSLPASGAAVGASLSCRQLAAHGTEPGWAVNHFPWSPQVWNLGQRQDFAGWSPKNSMAVAFGEASDYLALISRDSSDVSVLSLSMMKNSFPPRSLTDFRKSFRHCLLVIELRVWSRKVLPLIVWFRRLSMRLSKVSPISEAGTCTFITCICPKISQ